MTHLEKYVEIVNRESSSLCEAILDTCSSVQIKIDKLFDFKSQTTGLLLGNVQSGKTAQLLGIVCNLADKGFEIFIILTTDNVYLQRQTKERTTDALTTFNVYGEEEDVSFLTEKLNKPIAIVLKKNTNVLRKWRNLISSSGYCSGRPIVIIDDEADAASLNTLVNKSKTSTINKHLTSIKDLSSSSLFIQVTATPQAILLQSNISGWKPSFVHYFKPGSNYLGGDFVYAQPKPYCIIFTKEDELTSVKNEDYIAPGLRNALMSYLVVCGHFYLNELYTANFLVHPSVKIADHDSFSKAIGEHLNLLLLSVTDDDFERQLFIDNLKEQWEELRNTKPDIESFEDILEAVMFLLESQIIKVLLLNSTSPRDVNFQVGYNIIVGGNSLGRGVTFPNLQIVYYCRKAKTPQADTFWQHARVFGYDRDRGLLRIYMPPSLYLLFSELSVSNKLIINQIINHDIDSIQIIYPQNIKPTRAAVLDKKAIALIIGGVNFFSANPVQECTEKIDELLSGFEAGEKFHVIDSEFMIDLLSKVGDKDKNDWNNLKYINAVKALSLKRPTTKYALIYRTDRDIKKNTGTLLSPTDRKIGDSLKDWVVLTLYRVRGTVDKGWSGVPFFIPNIKLPDNVCIYDTIDL